MSVISNIHQIGDEADLPVLTVYHDGYTYFAEDTGKYYRWNGSSLGWDLIADGSATNYTDEKAQDAVGGMVADTDTVDFTYTDATPELKADVKKQMSITSDSSGLKLSGDSASPGNNKVYGTDGSGVKGWKNDPAGGGGATPPTQVDATDITGCTTWIDASQEAFSNGDAVGTASDFSAANNDATQGTAGNKPTFRTDVFNGKPAFYFGGDDFLVFGSNITHSTPTVIMVCNRYIRVGATYMTLLSIQKFGIYSRLNTALCFGVFNNGERIHGADLNFEPVILTVKYNTASNLSIYVNGQMVSASGGADGTATTSRIGWDGSASQYHQGFIAELRIYDNIISEADRLASEEWLGYNWRVPGYQGA